MEAKFSPRVRRLMLVPDAGSLRVFLEIAPDSDRAALDAALHEAGASIVSWSNDGRVITAEIPRSQLAQIAALRDVTYVEASDHWRT